MMWSRIAITGLGGGVFSGLAGIGGGTFMVPLMVSLLNVSQVAAHGTSLAIVVLTALASLLGYVYSVPIDWTLALVATVPSIATAPLGARSATAMPEIGLRRSFAGFLMVAALLLLLLANPEELFSFAGIFRYLVAAVIGVLAGFLSGLLGVGGGIFVVPATVFFLSMEQRDAQAFALAMMIPTSVAGTVAHTRLGNVRWRWAIGIALFSVPTGLLFGTLAGGWIDQQVLRYVFVALLIYFSLRMFGTIPWLRSRMIRPGRPR
jgi:hypothetical protein